MIIGLACGKTLKGEKVPFRAFDLVQEAWSNKNILFQAKLFLKLENYKCKSACQLTADYER